MFIVYGLRNPHIQVVVRNIYRIVSLIRNVATEREKLDRRLEQQLVERFLRNKTCRALSVSVEKHYGNIYLYCYTIQHKDSRMVDAEWGGGNGKMDQGIALIYTVCIRWVTRVYVSRRVLSIKQWSLLPVRLGRRRLAIQFEISAFQWGLHCSWIFFKNCMNASKFVRLMSFQIDKWVSKMIVLTRLSIWKLHQPAVIAGEKQNEDWKNFIVVCASNGKSDRVSKRTLQTSFSAERGWLNVAIQVEGVGFVYVYQCSC